MSNRLIHEASPYLRQHENNPVDWWPWSPQALAHARAEDKPILLSIGYSACHWCHVMAHESFEDEATARLMNDKFVCIKVDREERPDIDKIYQLAHQALTRRGGGWPLTMFLGADDLTPFYAGTYFPREARHGLPPFAYVLEQVRGFWDSQRDEVRKQNSTLRDFLDDYGRGQASSASLTQAPIDAAFAQITQNFDSRFGGHLGAPKFPHGAEMELLLDLGTPEALTMVDLSLARIAAGGIHDQIGGGFCRYSVDERWEIPHFEKMLYDNAQLLPLYAERNAVAHALPAIQRMIAWLRREMTAASGEFYAALDADSEHEEGKFYVWQRDEVRALLDDDAFAAAERHWGFDRAPNFEHAAWNPIVAISISDAAITLALSDAEVTASIDQARATLFAARVKRVRPGLDDKVLTAWNALMICGLARASRAQALAGANADADADMISLARRALAALHASVWRDGRLFAKAGADSGRFPAYLDDHAFLLDALIEFLQCEWNDGFLAWAIALADALIDRFEDTGNGGFWFTAHDHEALIQRPKPFADDAIPSGNGIAARALLRLGLLLGEPRFVDAAERTLRAGYATMQQMPQACASLQRALNDFLQPRAHAVVRVAGDAEEKRWRAAVARRGERRMDAYFIPAGAAASGGAFAAHEYANGGVAYLCHGSRCEAPTGNPEEFAKS